MAQERIKIKPKTKTRVEALHGLIDGEKCQMLKESGLVKHTKTVEDMKKDMVAKAYPKVKGELSKILEEIFPEKLSFGPPLR